MAFYFAATLSILSASSGVAQQVSTDSSATVVPLPKNIVTTTINVGGSPTRLGVTPNGDYVYVANSSSKSVSVISTSTNTVAATIPTGSDSFSVTVSPDGRTVYVGGYVTNSISVISTATNTISLPSGAWPHGLAVTPDGAQLYASDVNKQVSIWSIKPLKLITYAEVPSAVKLISPGPDIAMVVRIAKVDVSMMYRNRSADSREDQYRVGKNLVAVGDGD